MLWPNNIVDVGFYFLRIKWIIFFTFLIIAINLLLCFSFRTALQHYSRWQKILPSLIILFLSITIVIFNARNDLLLTILGSEDDMLAEEAYYLYKKTVTVPRLISLLAEGKESDNVKFYLARMLAEILQSSSQEDIISILNQIKQSPPIKPDFIGKNRLNGDISTFEFPMSPERIVTYYYGSDTSSFLYHPNDLNREI